MKYIFTLLVIISFFLLQANTVSQREPVRFDLIQKNTIQNDSLSFQIYPNPLKDNRLYIISTGSGEKHIEIFNVFGEKVVEAFTNEESLQLDGLTPGIYLFLLHQDGQKGLERLVVP